MKIVLIIMVLRILKVWCSVVNSCFWNFSFWRWSDFIQASFGLTVIGTSLLCCCLIPEYSCHIFQRVDSEVNSEYLSSDEERIAKCVICTEEFFIACPESDCLLYLCNDHRMTDCLKHKSAKRFPSIRLAQRDSSCSSESDSHSRRKRKSCKERRAKRLIAFYLRQLWFYNAGVHKLRDDKNQAYFHVWTENQAARGCEELGSRLSAFIEESGIGNSGSPCHLIAWIDSCAGQNKNFIVVYVWQFQMLKKIVITIDHKFLEPEHSFLNSDRDFAQVEKQIRKHDNVYTVDQYAQIFLQSQIKNKPVMTRAYEQ